VSVIILNRELACYTVCVVSMLRAALEENRGRVPARAEFSLFTISGPTQPFIQWVLGLLSLRVKEEREADHSLPSLIEINQSCSYTSTYIIPYSSLEVKWPKCESDHSSSPVNEVKKGVELCLHSHASL
jgi:hypothetical protein